MSELLLGQNIIVRIPSVRCHKAVIIPGVAHMGIPWVAHRGIPGVDHRGIPWGCPQESLGFPTGESLWLPTGEGLGLPTGEGNCILTVKAIFKAFAHSLRTFSNFLLCFFSVETSFWKRPMSSSWSSFSLANC